MQRTDTELKEDPHAARLILDRDPVLRQEHAVSGEVEATQALCMGLFDALWADRAAQHAVQMVRQVRETG